jgi:hypothetical protein
VKVAIYRFLMGLRDPRTYSLDGPATSAFAAYKRLMQVTADDRCRNAGLGSVRDRRFLWVGR